MKKINHHFVRIGRILFAIGGIAALLVAGLWMCGWFDEWVHTAGGYYHGSDTVIRGSYHDNKKGERCDITYEIMEVTGDVWIRIYDINMTLEEYWDAYIMGVETAPAYIVLEEIKKQYTLVDEIEVTEPGYIELTWEDYPKNRCYYIEVTGAEGSTYDYIYTEEVWERRAVKLGNEIKFWFEGPER